MRLIFILFQIFISVQILAAQQKFDLVIVGGNPGGIMSAISAARLGKTSVILERTKDIGGLPANGLGATDIATRGVTTGLFKEFVDRVHNYYISMYGKNSSQVKYCSNGYHFEPSVAGKIFNDMLNEYRGYITVLTMRQFDSEPQNVIFQNNRIRNIIVTNRINDKKEVYEGNIFLDATYEGDLAAAAGVPFRVGREGKEEFNEIGAGRIYKYWDGIEGDGSTFQGDNAVQAYNYRLCLTNNPQNRVLFQKPKNYNRDEYLSIIDDIWTGRNTDRAMMNVTQEMVDENISNIRSGNVSKLPGDKWGISKVTNMIYLPNMKTDANNQHGVFISTDLPEENWPWPTSSWEWRDKFSKRLREYTEGLFYFIQNDSTLPNHFIQETRKWGLAKDEYTDNGYFPRQVYVREGRRFEGVYFFTANDALPIKKGSRPPLHNQSITASHYALDSHAVRKRENNKVHLDGFLSYPTSPYTVPYGVMVPKNVDNLLFPVPVSGSHIGFSTLRMEPCWMAIGQAAGVAASIAIKDEVQVQNVNIVKLQDILIDQGATLIYYKDVNYDSKDFKMVQYLGVRGFLPEWKANLDDVIDEKTFKLWESISGLDINNLKIGKTLRRDALIKIYTELQKSCN